MTEYQNWPGEERIDRIAASHGDGEHYEILDKQNKGEKMAIVPKVKLLNEFAKVPSRGSPQAAGYDICAIESGLVSFGTLTKFKTGIAIEIPSGFVVEIKPRSGLAFKFGVDTVAGVIDSDYQGEIKVGLTAVCAGLPLQVNAGERIAQLVIKKVENENDFEIIEEFSRETERGKNGFGSTGYE